MVQKTCQEAPKHVNHIRDEGLVPDYKKTLGKKAIRFVVEHANINKYDFELIFHSIEINLGFKATKILSAQ